MKFNFKNQLLLAVGLVLLFNVLTTICKHWIFHSIGYVLAGMLWIVHPVYPENIQPTQKAFIAMRGAGLFMVLLGVFVRAYYY